MTRAWAPAVVAAALLGCRAKPACPPGFWPDAQRTARVLELLSADPEARELLGAGAPSACYSPLGEGRITTDPLLLLSSADDEREVAARAAHLLLHARERATGLVEGGDCTELVLAQVRAAEERGWKLEARVSSRLGLPEKQGELDRLMTQYRARCTK